MYTIRTHTCTDCNFQGPCIILLCAAVETKPGRTPRNRLRNFFFFLKKWSLNIQRLLLLNDSDWLTSEMPFVLLLPYNVYLWCYYIIFAHYYRIYTDTKIHLLTACIHIHRYALLLCSTAVILPSVGWSDGLEGGEIDRRITPFWRHGGDGKLAENIFPTCATVAGGRARTELCPSDPMCVIIRLPSSVYGLLNDDRGIRRPKITPVDCIYIYRYSVHDVYYCGGKGCVLFGGKI